MGSKLDAYQSELFELLEAQCLSFRTVAELLNSRGLKMTHQGIHGWYERRKSKLKQRNAWRQKEGVVAGNEFKNPLSSDVARWSNGLVTQQRVNKVHVASYLQAQISQEERKLIESPLTSLQGKRNLVARKR